jgi:hypothetical protein
MSDNLPAVIAAGAAERLRGQLEAAERSPVG